MTLVCVSIALQIVLDFPLGLFAIGVLAIVVLPLTLPTTRKWLREDGLSWRLPFPPWQSRSRISPYEPTSQTRAELHRLVWAAWRQVGLVWVAVFAAVLVGAVVWFFRAHLLANANLELVLVLAVAYAWPVLLGGLLFAPEQAGVRRRFFQERGVRASRLWWQRQMLGLIVLATPMAIAWLVTGMEPRDWSASLTAEVRQAYLSYCVVAYAAAQMCSLFISSLLVSLASSAMLAAAVGLWCAFAGRLGLPIWLAAGIPAAGLWTASRLRAPSWLLEWDKPRHWLPSVATLGVAACALVSAFTLFRIYEIPKVSPGFDVEAFTQQAAEQFVPQAAFVIQRSCEQIFSVADGVNSPTTSISEPCKLSNNRRSSGSKYRCRFLPPSRRGSASMKAYWTTSFAPPSRKPTDCSPLKIGIRIPLPVPVAPTASATCSSREPGSSKVRGISKPHGRRTRMHCGYVRSFGGILGTRIGWSPIFKKDSHWRTFSFGQRTLDKKLIVSTERSSGSRRTGENNRRGKQRFRPSMRCFAL